MASDLDKIRALISDRAFYVREQPELTGALAAFQVQYMPLQTRGANGVIITLESGAPLNFTTNPFTVDYESGVVTFTGTAPSPQVLTVEYSHVSLTDDSLQTLLDINADTVDPVRLAAADALDAIADSQAVIEKKIRLLDMDTDGAAVAKALRDHALMLRRLVYDDAFVESTFDIAEQIDPPDSAAWGEKIWKDWMREDL